MISTQNAVFRAAIAANVPVFMKGLSGIGKSAFIRDYARASGRHLESVILAHKDKADVGGIPTIRETRDGDTTTEFAVPRSEEHTSELQSRGHLVCRLLL